MSQQLGKNVERLGKPNKSTTLSFTGIVGEEYGHIHDENKGYSNKTNNGCSKKREEFKGILVLQQNWKVKIQETNKHNYKNDEYSIQNCSSYSFSS